MDSHACVIVAEAELGEGKRIREIFQRSGLVNPVHLIVDLNDLFVYCEGKGVYANRNRFPVPVLALVSLRMLLPEAGENVRRMRCGRDCGRMPIVLMVEDGEERELDAAYEAGANSYLRKPFSFTQFLERNRITRLGAVILGEEP